MKAPAPDLKPAPAAIGEVDLAVVIPVFKQPGFLAEAVGAVLNQRADFRIGTVIVDDGCPFDETRAVAHTFTRTRPGRVCYVRRENGGLSAARNTGIEWAMRAWPTARALYLLDADNRLHPDFLARAFHLLQQSPAEVGWVYPDFDMFGMPQNHSTRGEYSALMHLIENYCEAGSLIDRRMLSAGIRFDETMRDGFEDWDFWLQAVAAGFVGRHLPRAGFQYRKRMDSMLAGSERSRETIVSQIRKKQHRMFRPRSVMALARREMPGFAFYLDHGETVRFSGDPVETARKPAVARDQVRRRFVESLEAPAAVHFPPVMCFAAERAISLLAEHRIVRNVFWQAQILLRHSHCAVVSIEEGAAADLAFRVEDGVGTDGAVAKSPLIFVQTQIAREAARDPTPDWLESIARDKPEPRVTTLRVTLPAGAGVADFALPARPPLEDLLSEIAALRMMVQERAGGVPAQWRPDLRLPRSASHPLDAILQCGPVLPYEKQSGVRDFGFILPLSSFGGIERGIRNYAAVLRKNGWRPHLFLTWKHGANLNKAALQVFESVNFLSIEEAEYTHPDRHFFGVWTSEFGEKPAIKDALGLVAGMDAVLNNHSFAGHAMAAGLKRLGVKTYVGLHLTERMPSGQPLGNTHIALAYEHAYDGFVVISEDLRRWCVSQAVPASKIHVVPNAPSYESGPGVSLRAIQDRRRRGGPLRVLFLGRFDRQKGLDRLTEIIRRTSEDPIAWRLIGKAVVEDSSVELASSDVVIEPPAHTSEELDALYGWADVVILTSRFEGVPLTILESQRAGCVVVSTDVGAVPEIVSHGKDGFLIPSSMEEEPLVELFCRHLRDLAADRTMLRGLGLRAARRARRVCWDRSLAGWVAHLDRECPAGDRGEA